jgi:IclR family acetate operon transcriptional repressor
MHASGVGKALLAQMDEDRLDRILTAQRFERFTKYTLTDLGHLRENLIEVREVGYSVDDEEKNLGMRCIAAPVFDVSDEAVAGISVSGPISRVGEGDVSHLSRAVKDAAQALSLAIGGKGTPTKP